MRKYPYVDPFRGANKPIQGAAQEAIPPVYAAGMADKDLGNPVRARKIHQSFNRVVPIEGCGLRSYHPGFLELLLKGALIFLGKPVIADIHGKKISVEAVGIAPSARDHGGAI